MCIWKFKTVKLGIKLKRGFFISLNTIWSCRQRGDLADSAWMDDTWTFILHYYAEEEIGDRFQLEPYLIYLKIFWIAGCLSEVCVLQKGEWRCLKAFIQTKFSKYLTCYYSTNACIFKCCWQIFSNKVWFKFFLFARKIFESRFIS